MRYGCYRNGAIKIEPIEFMDLVNTWLDPDTGETASGLASATPAELEALGIFPAHEITPDYNPEYEEIIEAQWAFDDQDKLFKKNNTKAYRPVETVAIELYDAVRAECERRIFEVIPLIQQVNVLWGQQPDLGYNSWILAMRTESNRCEDLYMAAVTIEDILAVIWDFPAYQAPA